MTRIEIFSDLVETAISSTRRFFRSEDEQRLNIAAIIFVSYARKIGVDDEEALRAAKRALRGHEEE